MRNLGVNLDVVVDRKALLETLRGNEERHIIIVKEAREEFLVDAKSQLEDSLERLAKGQIDRLSVHLDPPQDHSAAYRTAIKSLEMHKKDTIELTADQVACLVLDQWDWMKNFLFSNKMSPSAARYIKTLGYDG